MTYPIVSRKISGGYSSKASIPRNTEPRLCPSKVKNGYLAAFTQFLRFKKTTFISLGKEMPNVFFAFPTISVDEALRSPVYTTQKAEGNL